MARGYCLNEDCDKESWRLTKPPGEYAGSGPTCPECGTTRVEIEYDEGESPHGQRTERRGGAPVAKEQQRQEQSMAPINGQPQSAGDALAQGALALTSDRVSPDQKAQAIQQTGGIVADAAARLFQYNQAQKEMKKETAQNVELQEQTKYPECAECGYVFKEINPGAEEVECPDCGAVYEIVE